VTDNTPILESDEVDRRMLLLAGLQDALRALGVTSCLARHQRLVLRYAEGPYGPSGLTDPQLYVLLPRGCQHVTADGMHYRLGSDGFPVRDPAAAAVAICAMQPALSALESIEPQYPALQSVSSHFVTGRKRECNA
jgi:hypothetical protein